MPLHQPQHEQGLVGEQEQDEIHNIGNDGQPSRNLPLPPASQIRLSPDELHQKHGHDESHPSSSPSSSSSSSELSYFIIKMTAIASLGGCLFGYDMGAIGGALPQLISTFNISDDSQAETIVSVLFLGGGIGAACGGTICDMIGRKTTILLTDIIFMIGASILYVAPSVSIVIVGRFIVGFGIAVSGIADVSYLHEIAPIAYRGAIVSVNEACISLGFLLAYLAGYVYSGESENNNAEEWRIIFGWAGILAFIQFVGMYSMPESPSWLLQQPNRYDDYVIAYKQIHGETSIVPTRISSTASSSVDGEGCGTLPPATELTSMKGDPGYTSNSRRSESDEDDNGNDDHTNDRLLWSPKYKSTDPTTLQQTTALHQQQVDGTNDGAKDNSIEQQEHYHDQQYETGNTVSTILYDTYQFVISLFVRFRRQSYIALYLSVAQQFCGQTSVLNYAPIIFAESMNNDDNDGNGNSGAPKWSTVAIGLVKFVVTVIVIARIEHIGRRKLLIIGQTIIALGLLCLIVAFGGFTMSKTGAGDDDGEGGQNSNYTFNQSGFQLALPGVLMVVSGYSMSFGPLTWLLTSELYPTHIRGRALGSSTIVTYICASIVTRTFLSAQSLIGPSKVFACYFVVTVMGITFSYMAVPDTGGKTVEQVDTSLRGMPWWRFEHIALGQVDYDFDDGNVRNGSLSGPIDPSFNDGEVGGVGEACYTRHKTPPRLRRKSDTRHEQGRSGEMA